VGWPFRPASAVGGSHSQSRQHALIGRDGLVASLAREQVATVRKLNERIDQLEREIVARTAQLAPSLLSLPSWASLTAAGMRPEKDQIVAQRPTPGLYRGAARNASAQAPPSGVRAPRRLA
jgi:transposase